MKKIKDKRCSLLIRTSFYQKQRLMHLRALAAFDYDNPDALLPEADVWAELEKALGNRLANMGFRKQRGEFLAAGACHVPQGEPIPACPVRIRVGAVEKRLNVFGDRRFTPTGGVTAPEPFTVMPLTWGNAFGGTEFPQNPEGKGLDILQEPDGARLHPLPNVEYPGALIASPGDRPAPACFLPRRPPCLVDHKSCGTYDDRWRVEYWPYVPPDFNLDNLNQADPDQWADGYFSGGEDVEIANMHPDEQIIRTHLPRLRARFFIRRKVMGAVYFNDLPSHLDTVWLFPGRKRGVCVWHGVTPVMDERCTDIDMAMVIFEPLDEAPKPVEFYDPANAPPPEPEAPHRASASPPERTEAAPPPGEGGPAARASDKDAVQPPTASASPKEAHARLEAMVAANLRDMERQLHGPELSSQEPALTETAGPGAVEEGVKRLLAALDASTTLKPEHAAPVRAALLDVEKRFQAERERLDRAEAEAKATRTPPEAPAGILSREEVLRRSAAGEGLRGLDLTGLDLSGADLRGADLAEAILDRANLNGADLTGANLDRAILTGARAEGVKADKAALTRVQAEGLAAKGASFEGADLSGADLTGADASCANFASANLAGAIFEGASLAEATCDGCRAEKASFSNAQACRASFCKAALTAADFTGACLENARFDEANAERAAFHKVRASCASFCKAGLRRSQCSEGGDFTKANLAGANLGEAVFGKSRFCEALLTHAAMDGAMFTDCLFERADLRGISAKRGCLDRSDLDGAVLREANLFMTSLRGAKLYNCDLRDANCFSADFYGAGMNRTLLEGANVKRTILAAWGPMRI